MADNPFEDPDVQAAAHSDGGGMPPPVPQNAYADNNAYDDGNNDVQIAMVQAAAKYVPADAQKQMAMNAGSALANQAVNKAQEDYNESNRTQSDQHAAPPPPSFCVNLFNWFPLRFFAFVGGIMLIAGPILDTLLPFVTTGFIEGFINFYLICFGIVIVFVESPSWGCTRFFQLKIFFWFRLLSRMWGRAWFYLFISILSYATVQEKNGSIFAPIAGTFMILICILSFIFSNMAAKKFTRIREFVAAGSEADELEGRFMRKFDELDTGGKPGTIGSAEIIKLAEQAGRTLSNSERHAIQTFLDESCNGYVSKEDFMQQFVTQYTQKGFRQRYL